MCIAKAAVIMARVRLMVSAVGKKTKSRLGFRTVNMSGALRTWPILVMARRMRVCGVLTRCAKWCANGRGART
ncbi:MAG: hypothetical protein ACK55Z_08020 [bacterium]